MRKTHEDFHRHSDLADKILLACEEFVANDEDLSAALLLAVAKIIHRDAELISRERKVQHSIILGKIIPIALLALEMDPSS